jgi:hypothetical protein
MDSDLFQTIYDKAIDFCAKIIFGKWKHTMDFQEAKDVANDIFVDSLVIMIKKPAPPDCSKDKWLFGIMRNQIKKFSEKRADEMWYKMMTSEEFESNPRPPSYYNRKKYFEEHKNEKGWLENQYRLSREWHKKNKDKISAWRKSAKGKNSLKNYRKTEKYLIYARNYQKTHKKIRIRIKTADGKIHRIYPQLKTKYEV